MKIETEEQARKLIDEVTKAYSEALEKAFDATIEALERCNQTARDLGYPRKSRWEEWIKML